MTMKVPEKMISSGPKKNPSPMRDWRTSGCHAYGDAEIRLLNPVSEGPKLGDLIIKVERK